MVTNPVVMRRTRRRESRSFSGVRVGRRGRLSVFRNGVPVRSPDMILAMTGRKV